MKLIITTFIASVLLSTAPSPTSAPIEMYPKNFIPFWSQAKRGHEVALLNTAQIVQIRPFFNPEIEKPTHDDIVYIEVDLVDGKTIEVREEFQKFYGRVRVSQSK
jgi:hypothetical protein